jgi:hypothetical protein
MHNNGNVVPVHKATTDQVAHSPLARLPAILLRVRDKAAQQLRHGLQALFDNADDTLFEMGDRARCDVEQNIFFQAMRDLRLKRKSIERGFLDQFSGAFIRLAQYNPALAALPQALLADFLAFTQDERSRRDLALELRNGVARVLDDILLFEQALASVIGNFNASNAASDRAPGDYRGILCQHSRR